MFFLLQIALAKLANKTRFFMSSQRPIKQQRPTYQVTRRVPWWHLIVHPKQTTHQRKGDKVVLDALLSVSVALMGFLLALCVFIPNAMILRPRYRAHGNSWDGLIAREIDYKMSFIPSYDPDGRGVQGFVWSIKTIKINEKIAFAIYTIHHKVLPWFEAIICAPWNSCAPWRLVSALGFISMLVLFFETLKLAL
jgi:hypothetical protein